MLFSAHPHAVLLAHAQCQLLVITRTTQRCRHFWRWWFAHTFVASRSLMATVLLSVCGRVRCIERVCTDAFWLAVLPNGKRALVEIRQDPINEALAAFLLLHAAIVVRMSSCTLHVARIVHQYEEEAVASVAVAVSGVEVDGLSKAPATVDPAPAPQPWQPFVGMPILRKDLVDQFLAWYPVFAPGNPPKPPSQCARCETHVAVSPAFAPSSAPVLCAPCTTQLHALLIAAETALAACMPSRGPLFPAASHAAAWTEPEDLSLQDSLPSSVDCLTDVDMDRLVVERPPPPDALLQHFNYASVRGTPRYAALPHGDGYALPELASVVPLAWPAPSAPLDDLSAADGVLLTPAVDASPLSLTDSFPAPDLHLMTPRRQ